MLAPLVMDLADKQDSGEDRLARPSLGRRDHGAHRFAVPAVPASSRASAIAIPSRFAVDFLFLRKMLAAGEHDARRHRDRRDAAAGHAGRALRQRGRRLLHGRAVRRGGAARGLCEAAAHDARRVAQLHLLRADGARGADRATIRPLVQDLVNHVLGAGVWLDAQQENRDKAVADRRRPRVLQPGPERSSSS